MSASNDELLFYAAWDGDVAKYMSVRAMHMLLTTFMMPLPMMIASNFSDVVMTEIYCGYCPTVNNREKIAHVKNRDYWFWN
jgi:hypothetical protein